MMLLLVEWSMLDKPLMTSFANQIVPRLMIFNRVSQVAIGHLFAMSLGGNLGSNHKTAWKEQKLMVQFTVLLRNGLFKSKTLTSSYSCKATVGTGW